MNAKINKKKLPENVAIDKDGKPTTDAAEAIDGALLPLIIRIKVLVCNDGWTFGISLAGAGFAGLHLENGVVIYILFFS